MKTIYQSELDTGYPKKDFTSMQACINFELLAQAAKEKSMYIQTPILIDLAEAVTDYLINQQMKMKEEYETLSASNSKQAEAESQHSLVRPTEDGQDQTSGHCGQDTGT